MQGAWASASLKPKDIDLDTISLGGSEVAAEEGSMWRGPWLNQSKDPQRLRHMIPRNQILGQASQNFPKGTDRRF